MTGTQFGQFILGLVTVAVVIAIAVWLLNWLYLRSSKERAFVRTGFGGQKVVQNGGAFVLPILHEVIPVNMNTLRLEVSRGRDKAIITRDRMRVDVVAEFYVRVQAMPDAIAAAAQTLGQRTMQPETLKELTEGKFVDALRTVAAEMTMEEMHEKRGEYVKRVRAVVAADLLQNGLELETVSLTQFDQTSMEFFDPSNAFDAEGLTRLTEQIERRKKLRNDIEQDTMIQIRNKNLDTERQALDIDRELEYAQARAGTRARDAAGRAARGCRARARQQGTGSGACADLGARGGRPCAHRVRARGRRRPHRARARRADARDRAPQGAGARRAATLDRRRPAVEGAVRGAGCGGPGAFARRAGGGAGVHRARDRDGRAAQEHRADRRAAGGRARRAAADRRGAGGALGVRGPRRRGARRGRGARPMPTAFARWRSGSATRSRRKGRD